MTRKTNHHIPSELRDLRPEEASGLVFVVALIAILGFIVLIVT